VHLSRAPAKSCGRLSFAGGSTLFKFATDAGIALAQIDVSSGAKRRKSRKGSHRMVGGIADQ
jgi:hypothetical protein